MLSYAYRTIPCQPSCGTAARWGGPGLPKSAQTSSSGWCPAGQAAATAASSARPGRTACSYRKLQEHRERSVLQTPDLTSNRFTQTHLVWESCFVGYLQNCYRSAWNENSQYLFTASTYLQLDCSGDTCWTSPIISPFSYNRLPSSYSVLPSSNQQPMDWTKSCLVWSVSFGYTSQIWNKICDMST